MKIGIVSAAGNGNLGDELFPIHWSRLFFGRAEVARVRPGDDVAQYDRLIVGGGDLLDLRTERPEFTSARYLTRPCWLYAVGCNWIDRPTPEATAAAAEFTRHCRGVYVRDAWSAAALRDAGGTVTGQVPDLLWAFTLPPKPPSQNAMGLVLRDEYRLIAVQRDAIQAAAAAAGLTVEELPRESEWVNEKVVNLSQYRVVVSTRLHFCLLALLYGIPVIPLYIAGRNRFAAVCRATEVTGISWPRWGPDDFRGALGAALSRDWRPIWGRVAQLQGKAIEQQRQFAAEVLA